MKNILPNDIVSMVRDEGKNLNFGSIKLEIILRDGHPRWEITRSRSILEETGSPTEFGGMTMTSVLKV
jgi:hypothetical protein